MGLARRGGVGQGDGPTQVRRAPLAGLVAAAILCAGCTTRVVVVAPSTSTTSPLVVVPYQWDTTTESAPTVFGEEAQLEALGLGYTVQQVNPADYALNQCEAGDLVVGLSPGVGSHVPRGTVVTIQTCNLQSGT